MGRKQKPPDFFEAYPRQPKGTRVPNVVPERVTVRPAYNQYDSGHCVPLRNWDGVVVATGIARLLDSAARVVDGRSNKPEEVTRECQSLLAHCNYSAVMDALDEYADNDDIRYVRTALASITTVKCGDCCAMIESAPDHICDPVARRAQARVKAEQNAQLAQMLNPRRGRRKA